MSRSTHSGVALPEGPWQTLRTSGPLVALVYQLRVSCDLHYYGPTCTKLCRPRHDTFGHYICSGSGDKVCLEGWMGPNCDTGQWRASTSLRFRNNKRQNCGAPWCEHNVTITLSVFTLRITCMGNGSTKYLSQLRCHWRGEIVLQLYVLLAVSNHWHFDCLLNSSLKLTTSNIKVLCYWPLVRGTHGWPVDSPHQRVSNAESTFSCNDATMISLLNNRNRKISSLLMLSPRVTICKEHTCIYVPRLEQTRPLVEDIFQHILK